MGYKKLYIQRYVRASEGSASSVGDCYETKAQFGIYSTDFPFAVSGKKKELYEQKWNDEPGCEVWVPPSGLLDDVFDIEVPFSFKTNLPYDGVAQDRVRHFIGILAGTEVVEGDSRPLAAYLPWLRLYDEKTGQGFMGVQYIGYSPDAYEVGDMAGGEVITFKVKFRVYDPHLSWDGSPGNN